MLFQRTVKQWITSFWHCILLLLLDWVLLLLATISTLRNCFLRKYGQFSLITNVSVEIISSLRFFWMTECIRRWPVMCTSNNIYTTWRANDRLRKSKKERGGETKQDATSVHTLTPIWTLLALLTYTHTHTGKRFRMLYWS